MGVYHLVARPPAESVLPGSRGAPGAAAVGRLFERLAIDVLKETDITGACKILRISWDEGWHLIERAVARGMARKQRRAYTVIISRTMTRSVASRGVSPRHAICVIAQITRVMSCGLIQPSCTLRRVCDGASASQRAIASSARRTATSAGASGSRRSSSVTLSAREATNVPSIVASAI